MTRRNLKILNRPSPQRADL